MSSRFPRFFAAFSVLLLASGAQALEPPKVVVTYSMDCEDGGKLVQTITDTPLGLGNQAFRICVGDDGSDDANVLTNDHVVEIEYTADPNTQAIVDGPVEMITTDFAHSFQVFAINGASTTLSDLVVSLHRESAGTLAGTLITWDQGANAYQSMTTGQTDCAGNAVICSLAAPPGGWPRVEDGLPKDRPIPLTTVTNGTNRAEEFLADNLTPGDVTDDILTNMDSQATVYNTWHGVETSRVFVPEPGEIALLAAGFGALFGVGAVRRRQV